MLRQDCNKRARVESIKGYCYIRQEIRVACAKVLGVEVVRGGYTTPWIWGYERREKNMMAQGFWFEPLRG